ncbi:MAG: ribonuclease HII [Coriobacteriia bacterium]|nr:ribonuclease HII [Coriobacteriia bacterium]
MLVSITDSHFAPKLSRVEKTAALDQALYGFLEELDCGRGLNIIGIDEVGRGSLAGPLTVAATSLPLTKRISGLNDSKKLSAKRREELTRHIIKTASSFSIIDIEAPSIDFMGIVEAVRQGMKQALGAVIAGAGEPDIVLIDGVALGIHAKEQAITKGDSRAACIAAASILAKTHRDALMTVYSNDYTCYGWQSNKGYGSAEHISAIKKHGLSELHRKSFCAGILQESF